MAHEPDNKILIDYLFGELSEPERARIEELYFTDDSLYEQLSAVENDLIDRYAQHTLSEPERKDFEQKYLTTPQRHKKVAESKQLINLIINYTPPSPKPSWWHSFLGFINLKSVVLQYSLAAALLVMILGCLWLVRERSRLAQQVAQTNIALRQKEAELQRQDEENRKASEKLQEDLRNEQARREQDAQQLAELQKRTQQAEESRQNNENRPAKGLATVATYIFPLVNVRGGQSQNQLVIRQGERAARLTIYLKNNSYQQYRVSIQRVSGEEAWSTRVPKGQRTSAGERLSFAVPASVFVKKDYILTIDAVKPDGSIDNLETRSFSVINKNVRQE